MFNGISFSFKKPCNKARGKGWFDDTLARRQVMSGDKVCIGLVSGGIDSPVAVARMLMKGWKVYPLHCTQEEITGPAAEQKTIALLRHFLQMEGPIGDAARKNLSRKLITVPVSKQLSLFTEDWNHKEYFIHMKRMFNKLADRAALEVSATHVLTGENLGQVSSQTLGNLGSIEQATKLHLLRPLLGFDKTTIMHIADEIGTFEISKGPEVCDALGPKHPATVANQEWLEKSEERVGGMDNICDEAWELRNYVDL
jgi:thiamine biosynthesis protein ThiI